MASEMALAAAKAAGGKVRADSVATERESVLGPSQYYCGQQQGNFWQ